MTSRLAASICVVQAIHRDMHQSVDLPDIMATSASPVYATTQTEGQDRGQAANHAPAWPWGQRKPRGLSEHVTRQMGIISAASTAFSQHETGPIQAKRQKAEVVIECLGGSGGGVDKTRESTSTGTTVHTDREGASLAGCPATIRRSKKSHKSLHELYLRFTIRNSFPLRVG